MKKDNLKVAGDELALAHQELIFQNLEKEKRAAELLIANKELLYQNEEKEKRAAELIIANKELIYQNSEKEKRASELIIANKELVYQNQEKENRAAELVIANKELVFQNLEKEKRAAELLMANKELEAFTFISSHDLQEPLRKIQAFTSRILSHELESLSDKGKEYFLRIQEAASRMQILIADLLAYSRTTSSKREFEVVNLHPMIEAVKNDLCDIIDEKHAVIEIGAMCNARIIPFQFRQLMHNLIGNALKFIRPEVEPHIMIRSRIIQYSKSNVPGLVTGKEYCHITISDNGMGFEDQFKDQIFDLFKRLHDQEKIPGTGIGLAIVKKIIDNHHGVIIATGKLNEGATFDIYLPTS